MSWGWPCVLISHPENMKFIGPICLQISALNTTSSITPWIPYIQLLLFDSTMPSPHARAFPSLKQIKTKAKKQLSIGLALPVDYSLLFPYNIHRPNSRKNLRSARLS